MTLDDGILNGDNNGLYNSYFGFLVAFETHGLDTNNFVAHIC